MLLYCLQREYNLVHDYSYLDCWWFSRNWDYIICCMAIIFLVQFWCGPVGYWVNKFYNTNYWTQAIAATPVPPRLFRLWRQVGGNRRRSDHDSNNDGNCTISECPSCCSLENNLDAQLKSLKLLVAICNVKGLWSAWLVSNNGGMLGFDIWYRERQCQLSIFYFKIGACHHGDRLSRIHNRPTMNMIWLPLVTWSLEIKHLFAFIYTCLH